MHHGLIYALIMLSMLNIESYCTQQLFESAVYITIIVSNSPRGLPLLAARNGWMDTRIGGILLNMETLTRGGKVPVADCSANFVW